MDKKYLKDFMEKNYKSKSQFRTEIEVRKEMTLCYSAANKGFSVDW